MWQVADGTSLPLKLNVAVYNIHVRLEILFGGEVWCLRESEIGILKGKRDPS